MLLKVFNHLVCREKQIHGTTASHANTVDRPVLVGSLNVKRTQNRLICPKAPGKDEGAYLLPPSPDSPPPSPLFSFFIIFPRILFSSSCFHLMINRREISVPFRFHHVAFDRDRRCRPPRADENTPKRRSGLLLHISNIPKLPFRFRLAVGLFLGPGSRCQTTRI